MTHSDGHDHKLIHKMNQINISFQKRVVALVQKWYCKCVSLFYTKKHMSELKSVIVISNVNFFYMMTVLVGQTTAETIRQIIKI